MGYLRISFVSLLFLFLSERSNDGILDPFGCFGMFLVCVRINYDYL